MKARNLEQKFSIKKVEDLILLCKSKRYRFRERLCQKDIYFHSKNGRLKIRINDRQESELILYFRADSRKARESTYFRLPLKYGMNKLREMLESSNGIIGEIEKERTVFFYNNIRINIDKVKGLGCFIEFEAHLNQNKSNLDRSLRYVEELKRELGIKNSQAIINSYIDLFMKKRKESSLKRRSDTEI